MTRKGNVCVLCGEEQAKSRFMKHRNDDFDREIGFCKTCVAKYDTSNKDEMISLFRMMNIPFVDEVWEDQFADGADGVLGKYLKAIAVRREFVDFTDSVYGNASNQVNVSSQGAAEVTDKELERWGSGREVEEYKSLERAYESLVRIRPTSTYQDEKRYVINVQLGLALEDAIKNGETKQLKSLRETYTKDLKELGLDVGNRDDEIKYIGQRIQEWERNEPIPEMSEEFKDVDGIGNYLTRFFANAMKRTFGQASEEEISEIDNYVEDGKEDV